MTDTVRALCEELVGTWDAKSELGFSDWRNKTADIVERARAALAEQPVWPMDKLDRLIALDRDDPANNISEES